MRLCFSIILSLLSAIPAAAAPALSGITPSEAFTFGPTIVQIAGTDLSPAPIWAFQSITNNVTQEVTVITPHRP